jgi:hypothetical protein
MEHPLADSWFGSVQMSIEKFEEKSQALKEDGESGEILLADGNCGWRACYGVSQPAGTELQPRNSQIQEDMRNVEPEGNWHPDPQKMRDWDSPSDWWLCHSQDPNLCVLLPDGRVVDRYQPNNHENNFYNQNRQPQF